MPFAANTMSEEERLKSQDKNGVNISGESASFATGVPGQEASGSGAKKQQGSGAKFANIQNYLQANQQQGEQMGQNIAGKVESEAQQAQAKVGEFQSKAPQVQAYDPSAAYKNVTGLSDADKQAYQAAKAGYKGPQNLDQVQGYGEAQKLVGQASQMVGQAGNEAGQRELIKQQYARPSYTAGENALDQVVLQNAPGAKKQLEGLTQKYSGLSGLFNQAAQDVGGRVNQAVQTGLANQRAIAEGEAKAQSGLLDPIKQRAAQLTESNKQLAGRVGEDISDEILSQETLDLLGLGEGQSLFDVDLRNYFTPNQTQVGINNAATADERARYAALTNLISGQPGQELTADGQAINPVSFNKEKFEKDLAGKSEEYKKAYEESRGTALDTKYLLNPNASGGYDAYIPGALTNRRDLMNSTPKELQEYWLPIFEQAAQSGLPIYSTTRDAIKKSLENWNNKFQSGRKIKKG